jgi:hypothetical protein
VTRAPLSSRRRPRGPPRRAGTPYHRLALGTNADGHIVTACGRFVSSVSTKHGVLLRDDEAAAKGSTACERCWPGGRP